MLLDTVKCEKLHKCKCEKLQLKNYYETVWCIIISQGSLLIFVSVMQTRSSFFLESGEN